uniref:Uncharacterized protein n=1 Tax=Panagrolaimus sp. ES5 TaxID=591445 RepID=A0AC34GUD4_9BILA
MQYDEPLDSTKILNYLQACRNCYDMRLHQHDLSVLPEHIEIANITFSNIARNYNGFELPQNTILDLPDDDSINYVDTLYIYPKIKHRNHVIQDENDDIILINKRLEE